MIFTVDVLVGLFSLYGLYKLTDRLFSSEKWLLGLRIVLPPTRFSNVQVVTQDKKKKKLTHEDLVIKMESIKEDLVPKLYFFKEFDYVVLTLYVLIINHVFQMVWRLVSGNLNTIFASICAYLLLLLVCKTLFGIIASHGFKTGEGFATFWASVLSFVLSLTAQQYGSTFTFQMDNAHQMLKTQVELTLQKHQISVTLPSNPLILKCLISSACAFVTYIVFKPSLRAVRSHLHLRDPLMHTQYGFTALQLVEILSIVNLFLPILYVLLWYQPVLDSLSLHLQLSSESLHRVQLFAIYLIIVFRLCFVRTYVQSYLLSPATSVENAKIKNEQQFAKMKDEVLNYLRYVVIATIQLTTVPLLLIPLAVLLNSKANISFTTNDTFLSLVRFLGLEAVHRYFSNDLTAPFANASSEKQMELFYGETFSFIVWWLCLASSVISFFGFFYYKINKETTAKNKEN